jgi:hypothetical protein
MSLSRPARAGGMARVVERLPNKYKALNSKPQYGREKRRKKIFVNTILPDFRKQAMALIKIR